MFHHSCAFIKTDTVEIGFPFSFIKNFEDCGKREDTVTVIPADLKWTKGVNKIQTLSSFSSSDS